MSSVSQQDLQIIEHQIGRLPRGVMSVETRCGAGHPQVIKVYPLLKQEAKLEPFPTLFWLTCPSMIEQISRLEHLGWIQKLEHRLGASPDALQALASDHQEYIKERWNTLSLSDRAQIETAAWKPVYLNRGIGGITDWAHIKCLHLHYAHHLARANTIGKWMDAEFDIRSCV